MAGGQDKEECWHSTVLLPEDILRESPSRKEGIPPEVEFRHRLFGCEVIQEAGILLRQPQVVVATAQNLFHRFFYRRPLNNKHPERRFLFDAFTVAMGSIFLASKIEEKYKRPMEVIFIFHHICWKRRGIPIQVLEHAGTAYFKWRSTLLEVEKYILKELGFTFYNIMDHPHKFILYYIKILDGSSELAQRAWNYLNDSLRLDCCVRYRAEVIASAAICMAARDLKVKLPDNPPWWELFGATLKDIKRVSNTILSLYHQEKIRWLEPLHPMSFFSRDELAKLEGHKVGEVKEPPAAENGKKDRLSLTTSSPASSRPPGETTPQVPTTKPSGDSEPRATGSEKAQDDDMVATTPQQQPSTSSTSRPPEESSERSKSNGRDRKKDKYRSKSGHRGGRSRSRSRSRSRHRKDSRRRRGDSRDRDRDRDRDHDRGRKRGRSREGRRDRYGY